jgi:hypothetical protein
MARQDFAEMVRDPSLVTQVERIVVDAHRRLYEQQGRKWSKPVAYHWLRYEDPMPVLRLLGGVQKLRRRGASFDADAVEKVCIQARTMGYLN